MKIEKIHFPIYGVLVIASILIGMLYVYFNISKEKRKNVYLYFILYISFALVFGKIYTMLTTKEPIDFIHAGISSIGGVCGTILASYIFEKIESHQNKIIKYTILSLPLVYGLSKIGCFLVGCCYGIPYSGPGYVIYPYGINSKLFPIQLVEVILFLILFVVLNYLKNHKNIVPITLISSSILKLLLDFLRYDHLTKIITVNQIFCIIIIIITMIYIWKRGRKNDNRRIKTNIN